MCQALGQRSFRAIIKLKFSTDKAQVMGFGMFSDEHTFIRTITNKPLVVNKMEFIDYIFFNYKIFLVIMDTFKPIPVIVISL